MLSASDRALKARRQALRRLRALAWIAGLGLFTGAIFLSGRIGVEMARNRLPKNEPEEPRLPESEAIRVGRAGDPLYLAQSLDSLRRFFARHPSPGDRASADLSGRGIRRLQDSIELVPLRTEADAIEVRISSGAIAGGIYWMHHSQLPAPAGFDPIISPVPGAATPGAAAPGGEAPGGEAPGAEAP